MSGALPRLVFFGSGSFGVPVLQALAGSGAVALVVSQPDRPAGRGSALTPTPVSVCAAEAGIPLMRPDDCNAPNALQQIRATGAPVFVVIAYGQKLGPELLRSVFAINLHGSLLPKWRGAAPYQRALMAGDASAGVSVIAVASRMDAGDIYAQAHLAIGPAMTAGELHDALSALGPTVMLRVLRDHANGRAVGVPQDESQATRAPKLSRAEAWVNFAEPASAVRARINGLSPWPACMVEIGGHAAKLLRVEECARTPHAATPRDILPDGAVACGTGAVRILEIQSAGSRAMDFDSWRRGRAIAAGARATSSAPRTEDAAPSDAGA